MNDNLTSLFLLYIHKKNKTQRAVASVLGCSEKTFSTKLKTGVSTWKLDDIMKVAEFLQIPIVTLRENITYRKENNT